MTENDFAEILRRRAEKNSDLTFEQKHAVEMEKLNRKLQPRISAVRVVLPAVPPVSEKHQGFLRRRTTTDMVVGRCRFCEPDPRTWKCPACDYEVTEKFRMTVHNISYPRWCQDRASKKAKVWSRNA